MRRSRLRPTALLLALTLLTAGCRGDAPPPAAAGGHGRAAVAAGMAQSGDAPDGTTTTVLEGGGDAPRQRAAPAKRARGFTPATIGSVRPTTTSTIEPTTTTTTTTAPVGGCPDPRGCADYRLLGGRWPRDAKGVVTIHYLVKADGNKPAAFPAITPEQTIAAVRAAAQTWMDAVPTVRLVYGGTTTADPREGNNVVGWGGPTSKPEPNANGFTDFTPTSNGPTYSGFSITLNPTQPFTWRPCDPANGKPCDNEPSSNPDLQGVLTHEFGHALGLDHVVDGERDVEMTMCGCKQPNGRNRVTLGLGDILGVRSLYPTNAPMPVLYRP